MTNTRDKSVSPLYSSENDASDGEDFEVIYESKDPLLNTETSTYQIIPLDSHVKEPLEGNPPAAENTCYEKMATVRSYLQARKQYLPTFLLLISVTLYLPYSYVSVLQSKEQHFQDILLRTGFQRVDNRSHLVFSAYLDDRFPGEPAKIRILGFKNKKDTQPLYCKLYFQSGNAMCVNTPAIELRLDSKETESSEIQCLFHCSLPEQSSDVPVAVTLTSSNRCTAHDHAVPVHILQGEPGRKKDIAVCFSSPSQKLTINNQKEIIEILELSKYFGASVVQMYNDSIHPDLVMALEKYTQNGFLNILQWDLGERYLPDLARTLSINDCIYRNMPSYKNVVFADKDEIIIPSSGFNSSWKTLIERVRQVNPGVGAFWFRDATYVSKEGLSQGVKPNPLPPACPLDKFPQNELPRIFTHRFIVQPKTKSSQYEYRQLIVDPSVVLYVDTDKKVIFLPGKSSNYMPTEFGQGIHFISYKSVLGVPAMETFRSSERIELTCAINGNLPFTRKADLSSCRKK